MSPTDPLVAFEQRFRADGAPPEAWQEFARMYRAYRTGAAGKIPWGEVEPLREGDLIPLAELGGGDLLRVGRAHRSHLVWIVLNGGLGTSMEMDRAKSLVPVKGELTFLDLIARHVLELRRRWECPVPVVFMHSFATREDSLRALAPYDLPAQRESARPLPLDFVQHRFPRIGEADGRPFGRGDEREDWAPPGHGNLYLALRTSGLLEALLDRGYRWAFVSNADNLAASPHLGILGKLAAEGLEFLMEVTRKTAADVKGGTLVRRRGRLELLELAQVPAGHEADFQDVGRFPVFNTNNLWIDLEALRERLEAGTLDLPVIVNRKRVGETPVVQLETAMGAAIGSFPRSAGVLVPRDRFAPVKTTDDLLVRRSDAYVPGREAPLVPNPRRDPALGPPVVRLDPAHYRSVPALDRRIPDPPSLLEARRLEVIGDVRFGTGVVVRGAVRVENAGEEPLAIPDGAVLSG
ncbi:MAG: UTP--glucose-1-phosphate uridylyltransferase [Deferrisomatales bacterium]